MDKKTYNELKDDIKDADAHLVLLKNGKRFTSSIQANSDNVFNLVCNFLDEYESLIGTFEDAIRTIKTKKVLDSAGSEMGKTIKEIMDMITK